MDCIPALQEASSNKPNKEIHIELKEEPASGSSYVLNRKISLWLSATSVHLTPSDSDDIVLYKERLHASPRVALYLRSSISLGGKPTEHILRGVKFRGFSKCSPFREGHK